jgi:hypothetical protein
MVIKAEQNGKIQYKTGIGEFSLFGLLSYKFNILYRAPIFLGLGEKPLQGFFWEVQKEILEVVIVLFLGHIGVSGSWLEQAVGSATN